MACGGIQHVADELAGPRGVIEAALAGEYQVGRTKVIIESGEFRDALRTGRRRGTPGHQAEAGATGRAGAGSVRIGMQTSRIEDSRPAGQAVIELLDVGRSRTLLGSEHGRGALRAVQRGRGVDQ